MKRVCWTSKRSTIVKVKVKKVKQSIEINTNTDNPNQYLIDNLNIMNQQQFPISRFETNIIQQFQDQQTHSTTKPVCALLVFGILLIIFNVLAEGSTLRVPIAGPDCFVRLELLLYLIYAGLEIYELIFIYAISKLAFHIFDFIHLFFESRFENKIVYVLLQPLTSSQPVWRMLLIGIILCYYIIWSFFSLLHGGLRHIREIIISSNEIECPFLINAFYLTIILIVVLFFLFLVLVFKLVKDHRKNTKVKVKDR